MKMCDYCSNIVEDDVRMCDKCAKEAESIYKFEMTCNLCKKTLEGNPNDGDMIRYGIEKQSGGWEEWESDWREHIVCTDCYKSIIEPLFADKENDDEQQK